MADANATEDLKGGRVKNRRRVLDLLRQNGALNRTDLAALTGLSPATVSSLVSELRQHRLVVSEELRKDLPRTGRPPSMVALRDSIGAAVGINITWDAIQVAVGDVGLKMLVERELRPADFEIGQNPQATLHLTAEVVKESLTAAGLDQSQVVGGAIAVPAPIDTRDGTVGLSSLMRGWLGSQPATALESLLGFPFLLANDANLSAFAEAVAGAVEGAAQVLYIVGSYVLGAGLIINGRPYSGATGGAGEIAHMVVRPGGDLCFCGRRGCLAMVVNAADMVAEVQSGHRRVLATSEFAPDALEAPGLGLDQRLELVVEWARQGDPISARVLRDAGRDLGIAVANVCQIINPERVVVGGVMTKSGDVFMGPFTRAIHEHTTTLPGPPVPVVRSHWQERAELVGAVALGVRAENDAFAARLWALVETALLDRQDGRSAPSTT